jgi:hypothetical protein
MADAVRAARQAQSIDFVWPWRLISLIIGLTIILIITYSSLNREYFNFRVETDFLGSFIKEAEQVQNGGPLAVKYHLPGYPFVIAGVEALTGDWFVAGRIIAWVSSVFVLLSTYFLASGLLGRAAGAGVLVTIGASSIFYDHGAMVTTDMLFLAVYSSAILVFYRAYIGNNAVLWALAGVLLGVCVLIRINGIICFVFLALPFMRSIPRHEGLRDFLITGAGVFLPLSLWCAYALATGSPLTPTNTHVNLAQTFYADSFEGLKHGDFLKVADGAFSGIWDVLTFDPARIPLIYALNLSKYFVVASTKLVFAPVLLLFGPGLLLLLFSRQPLFWWFLIVITLMHFGLVSLKDAQGRFLLFLLPVYGLGFAATITLIHERLSSSFPKFLFNSLLVVFVVTSFAFAGGASIKGMQGGEKELLESVPLVRAAISEPEAVVISRKPHMSFYSGATSVFFPVAETITDLKASLIELDLQGAVYLYFGSSERQQRPGLSQLSSPEMAVDWLEPVASGNKGGGWVLYKLLVPLTD